MNAVETSLATGNLLVSTRVSAKLRRVQPSTGGRVRGWRLGLRLGISVSSLFPVECLTSLYPILVSIPCLLEPDVRFSLIRLSDNLLPGVFKVSTALVSVLTATSAPPVQLRLLALRYSPLGSSREFSEGVIGLAACTVTYLPAGLG